MKVHQKEFEKSQVDNSKKNRRKVQKPKRFEDGLLGSTWLYFKTENKTIRHMLLLGKRFFIITLMMIIKNI